VAIKADSAILIRATDRDAAADDAVGDAILTDPSRWGLSMALPMAPADPGQIARASVTLGPGPTWWSRHGKLVVLVAIFGGGLGAWIVVRQISHRAEARAIRRAEDAKLRKCAHCETRIAISDARCSHCGAPQPPIADAA
jgi:hypothetical protein